MPKTKTKKVKKVTKQKQNVNVNVVVNSNNRRKVISRGRVTPQNPIVIPTLQNALPSSLPFEVKNFINPVRYQEPAEKKETLQTVKEEPKTLQESAKEVIQAPQGENVKIENILTPTPRRRARFLVDPVDVMQSETDDGFYSPGESVSAGSHVSFATESDVGGPAKSRVQALRDEYENQSSISPKRTRDASTSPIKINLPQIKQFAMMVEGKSLQEVNRFSKADKSRYGTSEMKQRIVNYLENLKE